MIKHDNDSEGIKSMGSAGAEVRGRVQNEKHTVQLHD